MAKLFFTSSQIFEVLKVFGDLTEEIVQKTKYAKWRAAYITKCIKNGENPQPPSKAESEITAETPNLDSKPSDNGESSFNTAPYPTTQFGGQPTPFHLNPIDNLSSKNQESENNFSSIANKNPSSLPSSPKPKLSQPSSSTDSSCSSFPTNASALSE